VSLLLVVLLVALAAAGGFLGDLLQLAGWLVLVLVAVGAVAGFLLYRWVERVTRRWR